MKLEDQSKEVGNMSGHKAFQMDSHIDNLLPETSSTTQPVNINLVATAAEQDKTTNKENLTSSSSPSKYPQSRKLSRSFSPVPIDSHPLHQTEVPPQIVEGDDDEISDLPLTSLYVPANKSSGGSNTSEHTYQNGYLSGESEIDYDDEASDTVDALEDPIMKRPILSSSPFKSVPLLLESSSKSESDDEKSRDVRRTVSMSIVDNASTSNRFNTSSRHRDRSLSISRIPTTLNITRSPANSLPNSPDITNTAGGFPNTSVNDPSSPSRRRNTGNTPEPTADIEVAALLSQSEDDDSLQLAPSKKNMEFHECFPNIPKDENLIADYSCALQKDILAQGKLYVTATNFCFYSKIFTWIQSNVIPIQEVTAIEKRSVAGFIPNSIEIITPTQKYFLASFLQRDVTFDLMVKVWQSSGKGVTKKMATFRRLSRSRPNNCTCQLDDQGNLIKGAKECEKCAETTLLSQPPSDLRNSASTTPSQSCSNLSELDKTSDEELDPVVVISDEEVQQYSLYDNEGEDDETENLPSIKGIEFEDDSSSRGRTLSNKDVDSKSISSKSSSPDSLISVPDMSRENSTSSNKIPSITTSPDRRSSVFEIGISANSRSMSRSRGLADMVSEAVKARNKLDTPGASPISPPNGLPIIDSRNEDKLSPNSTDSASTSPSKYIVHQKHPMMKKVTGLPTPPNSTLKIAKNSVVSVDVSKSDVITSPKVPVASVSKPIDPNTPQTPAKCNCTEHAKMVKALDPVIMPASLELCWQLMYGDRPTLRNPLSQEAPFLITFLTKRKCKDPKGSSWYPTAEEIPESEVTDIVSESDSNAPHLRFPLTSIKPGMVRKLQYQMPLFNPLGPSSTTCFVREEIVAYEPNRFLCIKSSSQTPDVPGGNCFITNVKLCFTSSTTYGTTSLRVSCEVEWIKSSWLRVAVDRAAPDGIRAYYVDLADFLPKYVTERPELENQIWYLNRPTSESEQHPAEPTTRAIADAVETTIPQAKEEVKTIVAKEETQPEVRPISTTAVNEPTPGNSLTLNTLTALTQQQQDKIISHQRQQMLVTLALVIAIWALAVAVVLHAAAFVYLGISKQQQDRQFKNEVMSVFGKFRSNTNMIPEQDAAMQVGEDIMKKIIEKIAKRVLEFL
ncbi:hypothetical protein HK098_007232 [Nowakowskiella sp. JEL0407]|nr:hypothetical protein HK098_007232 [Nowakowskiella sp. JEL0407]